MMLPWLIFMILLDGNVVPYVNVVNPYALESLFVHSSKPVIVSKAAVDCLKTKILHVESFRTLKLNSVLLVTILIQRCVL